MSASVCDETFQFKQIRAGDAVQESFLVRSDSDIAVEGTLADGTQFQGRVGYVTGGMFGERVRIFIMPGGGIEWSPNDPQCYRVAP